MEGVLARRAQAEYDATPAAGHDALRAALIELADVNERGDFTRRRMPLASLPTSARPALERFVNARLLVAFTVIASREAAKQSPRATEEIASAHGVYPESSMARRAMEDSG